MPHFIDLSHTFEDGMPGFKLKNEDGTFTQYTAQIKPFMTHAESRPKFEGKAAFEVTEITFQTSIGTYLDAPYHRFADRRDISQLALDEVILQGIVLDVRERDAWHALRRDELPDELDVSDKAVLFNFGWDQHWGNDQYHAYPFISADVIDYLIVQGAKLVGVDCVNIDDSRNLNRPAHTELLKRDILIVENLANLHLLHGLEAFRFFAVPMKARAVAAMPVRAFVEVL